MQAGRRAAAKTCAEAPGMIPNNIINDLEIRPAVLLTLKELSCTPPDLPRHWHPQSQTYASGDCLLSALDSGWRVRQVVYCSQWKSGNRRVLVYYFGLQQQDEARMMPIIGNPFIERLLAQSPLELAANNEMSENQSDIDIRKLRPWQTSIPAFASMSSIVLHEKVYN